MMKRTLVLSRALSEQTDKSRSNARGRKFICLGSHFFPLGLVFFDSIRLRVFEWCSSVKTFVDINIFWFCLKLPKGKLAMLAACLSSVMTPGSTSLSFFDLLDAEVLELNKRPMTKKTYVPFAGSLKATDIIVFEDDGAV